MERARIWICCAWLPLCDDGLAAIGALRSVSASSGGKFTEGAARQPDDLIPLLRTQFFYRYGSGGCFIPMIAVGLGLYVMFAVSVVAAVSNIRRLTR